MVKGLDKFEIILNSGQVSYIPHTGSFCQTTVLGLGLGVDFTVAWNNNNNNNNDKSNHLMEAQLSNFDKARDKG